MSIIEGHGGMEGEREVRSFEIWPNRSLDRRGLGLVLGAVFCAFAVVVARQPGPAVVPAAVACGAAFLFLTWAFWSNNRAARFAERIDISPRAVRVIRYGPAAAPVSAEFTTHWVRVEVMQDRYVTNRINLRERGRVLPIGDFLSSDERSRLAAELEAVLARMRDVRE